MFYKVTNKKEYATHNRVMSYEEAKGIEYAYGTKKYICILFIHTHKQQTGVAK